MAKDPTTRLEKPGADLHRETWQEQVASFVGFFIYLLILKTFFLPLFIIPTGSMAETLYGAHAIHTCPNCGTEYPVGWQPQGTPTHGPYHPVVQCPNCRYRQYYGDQRLLDQRRAQPDALLRRALKPIAGDRIFVNGWPFEELFSNGESFKPQRWDVIVFKVPTDGETNYIKRLIGQPNEKIEIIDGDIFVNDQIAEKTPYAQQSLWFPYYNHDFPPKAPSQRAEYHPRWVPLKKDTAWSGLNTRVLRFDGLQRQRDEIQFATDPLKPLEPGRVEDVYAYNEPQAGNVDPRRGIATNIVTDVRLSAEIDITSEDPNGFVELSTSNDDRHFYARLFADGRVKLLGRWTRRPEPEVWGSWQITDGDRPVRIALCHTDGRVSVEVNGHPVPALRSSSGQYTITPTAAREHADDKTRPRIRFAATNVQATLRHVLIERDVYYTSDLRHADSRLAYGVEGQPIQLGPEEYYLLGDNSPSSQDARFAFAPSGADPVGPHLRARAEAGEFKPGTVPADQLIGPAFFVYWPGFMRLPLVEQPILPDLGRVRWVR